VEKGVCDNNKSYNNFIIKNNKLLDDIQLTLNSGSISTMQRYIMWGCGGVVVSALDFRPEGQWFDAQSLP